LFLGLKTKSKEKQARIENGILYLKGGDLTEELKDFQKQHNMIYRFL
jgi:hypothetical protein